MRGYFRLLRALWRMRRRHPQWFNASDRSHGEREPWPSGFGPDSSHVYAHNRVRIDRPARELFRKLAAAEQWPEWYENSTDVDVRRPRSGRFARALALERLRARVGRGGESSPSPEPEPGTRTPSMFADPPSRRLGPNVEFRWTTFGIRVRSRVEEFEPDRRIAWTARALGLRVYHRWYFTPDGAGTIVVTEECEKGLLPRVIRRWMNPALHAGHRLWLESLKHGGPSG